MYRNRTVGVVVPAYNEAGFVGTVISTVPEFVDRVYVVDDGSTDGTWAEITECAAALNGAERTAAAASTDGGVSTDGRVVAVRHAENRGVGGAITTGYRLAAEDGMDVVAVMNADEQMDPAFLDRLLDPIVEGRADYAKGNRLGKPEYRESMSRWRLFGNGVLTLLTRAASGYWGMTDPQNGYTAISREAIETLDLDSLFESYGFCNDVLVRLNVHGFRVVDVEMPAIYGEETSHISYSTFVPQLSLLLARRFVWRLRTRAARGDRLAALYGLGGLGVAAAFVSGLRARWQTHGRSRHGLAAALWLAFAAFAFVAGVAHDRRDDEDLEGRE